MLSAAHASGAGADAVNKAFVSSVVGLLAGCVLSATAFADEALWQKLSQRAASFYEHGRYIEGVIAAEEALREAERIFEPYDFRLAESLNMLAVYYRRAGREQAAEVLDRRAHEVQRVALIERQLGFDMRWEYGEVAGEWPQARHVMLRFVDFPQHVIGIYSKDLWLYLATLPTREVYVTFAVFYDVEGRMSRYQITHIGDLAQWHEDFRYAGAETYGGPSPWDLPVAEDDASDN